MCDYELFACGFNGFKQIKSDNAAAIIITEPTKLTIDTHKQDDVPDVRISWSEIIIDNQCLLEDKSPVKIDSRFEMFDKPVPFKVLTVKYGKEHVILLTDTNQVYSWGLNSRGQLGNGDIEEIKCPEEIEAFSGIKIKTISAGGWHSAAITSDGDLYTWGWNESGQLGIPCPGVTGCHDNKTDTTAIATLPVYIELPSPVSQVSCGSRHTVVLLENGDVMSSGWNKYGQLGLGHTETRDNFTQINFPVDIIDNHVCLYCLHWNSVFLVKYKDVT